MVPSDISLNPIAREAHKPLRTAPATPPPTPAAGNTNSEAPSFSAVFASASAAGATTPTSAGQTAPATAGQTAPADTTDGPAGPLFGADPWLTDPTGSGPGPVTNYNPVYFATPQTAQTVAQMVGGTVVSMNEITSAPGSPFQQDEPNLMVQLPNGGLINPGLVADIYTHGWNQAFVNQQVANEVAGAVPSGSNG